MFWRFRYLFPGSCKHQGSNGWLDQRVGPGHRIPLERRVQQSTGTEDCQAWPASIAWWIARKVSRFDFHNLWQFADYFQFAVTASMAELASCEHSASCPKSWPPKVECCSNCSGKSSRKLLSSISCSLAVSVLINLLSFCWFNNVCCVSSHSAAATDASSTGSNSLPEGDESYFPYLKSGDCEELDRHCPISQLEVPVEDNHVGARWESKITSQPATSLNDAPPHHQQYHLSIYSIYTVFSTPLPFRGSGDCSDSKYHFRDAGRDGRWDPSVITVRQSGIVCRRLVVGSSSSNSLSIIQEGSAPGLQSTLAIPVIAVPLTGEHPISIDNVDDASACLRLQVRLG